MGFEYIDDKQEPPKSGGFVYEERRGKPAPSTVAAAPKAITNDNPNFIDNAIISGLQKAPNLTNWLERTAGQGTQFGRLVQGAADAPVGAMQLLMNAFGQGEGINPKIAEIKQRTQALRGPDAGFDWAGLAGNLANPLPYKVAGALPTATNLATRIGQGAAIGAGMGAVTPVDKEGDYAGQKAVQVGTGAAMGAVLQPLVNLFGRGAGAAWDLLKGKFGDVKAADIVRKVAGGDINAIRAATANAPNDITTSQAAAGVKNDMFDALGKLAQDMDKTSYFSRLYAGQQQNRMADVARIAGGATQTDARVASQTAKNALNAVTTPMRDVELAAANTAGSVGRPLQAQADRLSSLASNKVQDVRTLSQAGEAAERLAQSGRMRLDGGAPPVQGLPRIAPRYSYGTELAQRADEAASNAANTSLIAGDAARFAQSRADSLAAYGLKPLDTKQIVSSINSKLNDPSIGPNTLNSRVLRNVGELIDDWTQKNGGVIDARAIYEIRKSAVNNEIEKMLAGADPKAQAKRASQILSEIRPLIDDAIEKAGGTGWRQYLNTFEMGMRQIDKQKLGARAMEMLSTNPKAFVRLALGNDPKTVRKIFGSEFDVAKAMGSDMPTLTRAASEIARDESIAKGASAGEAALTKLLEQNSASFRLPNFLNPKITAANRALSVAEARVNEKTMQAIYDAMKTGGTLEKLLQNVPANQRINILAELTRANPAGTVPAQATLQSLLTQGQQ